MIERLFKEGYIIHHYPFKVLYIFSEKTSQYPAQIAISVSKKIYKRAVDRNYIKRKIRESYRKNKEILYNEINRNNLLLNIFLIYNAKTNLSYEEIDIGVKGLIQKIISLSENANQNIQNKIELKNVNSKDNSIKH